jgi:murein DD-endopeptidase MepM/ murein hydrolase activator NlpD
LTPFTESNLQRLQALAHRHRRSIVATAVTLLAGFGISAVAIAPLAPDAAQLPQRLLTEAVQSPDLNPQLDALEQHDLALVRNDITRGTDSAEALLARLGVADASAAAFLRSDRTARLLVSGRGGKMVQALTDADGNLVELVARFPAERAELARTHFTRMNVARTDGRWLARLETVELGSGTRLASGTIQSSLFAATDAAQLPDAVAAQLAEIFATDIDFHRELRRGDTFSVVYETLTADGEPVAWNEGAGRVLAAEFVNGGRAYHAVWFTQASGKGGYFGLDGSSRQRSFLASPMEFSRVTSGFAMRFHPIQRSWRRHLGVDYGAPVGTAVRSVGQGVVDFAGWQNGYGKVVQVQHGNDRSTLYAHLNSIDVRKGQRVEQGQRIGAVGMTGWTTGPHLHFEFRQRGEHQDPIRIAKAAETIPLEAASRQRFAEVARVLQGKLDVAETLASARPARFE